LVRLLELAQDLVAPAHRAVQRGLAGLADGQAFDRLANLACDRMPPIGFSVTAAAGRGAVSQETAAAASKRSRRIGSLSRGHGASFRTAGCPHSPLSSAAFNAGRPEQKVMAARGAAIGYPGFSRQP